MSDEPGNRESGTFDRRKALQATGVGVASFTVAHRISRAQQSTPAAQATTPVTGDEIPELVAYDSLVLETMAAWHIPGVQLAIARGDQLVYSRGFGYASVEDSEVVETDARFRIASTTKPVTAVAILMLIDAGKLTLDTPVFPLLGIEPIADAPYDPRLDLITIEQLLSHSGGWNSAATFDPQYTPWPELASHLTGAESPAAPETIIRYMLSQPLDFDPGTQSAYSNFGFNVLGRVIEKISGQSYEEFVTEQIAKPAGITSMALGGTLLEERLSREVRYYAQPGSVLAPSVYPEVGFAAEAYGGYYLPALDAHGGLISSAEDLIRFILAVDGTKGPQLLTPETVEVMQSTVRPPSAYAGAGNSDEAHGLGFGTKPTEHGYEWSHAGALTGSTASWLIRNPDGTTIAIIINTLPDDYATFFGGLFPSLQQIAFDLTDWPTTNLWA
jgi:N-acyl-D-amino-acid deacylase